LSFQKKVCQVVNTLIASLPGHGVPYLVTVSPEVVLGTDVLVRVLGPLRAGVLVLLVGYVLPVSVPPDLGVDTGNDDAGDGNAIVELAQFLVSINISFQEMISMA
jgi:hypothetical protein